MPRLFQVVSAPSRCRISQWRRIGEKRYLGFLDDGFLDDEFIDDGLIDDGFIDDGFIDDGFSRHV